MFRTTILVTVCFIGVFPLGRKCYESQGAHTDLHLLNHKNTREMRLIHLSVPTIIGRLYLVMAIVLIAGFTQLWFLSVLALPIFISVMGGIHLSKQAPYMKESERLQNQQALHHH